MKSTLLILALVIPLSCSKGKSTGSCYEKEDLSACKSLCEDNDPKGCAITCIKTSDEKTCRKACNLKSKTACLKLRKISQWDKKRDDALEKVEKKTKSKQQIYEENCEKGKADACLYLAQMFEKGIGAQKFTGSKSYYDKFDNYVKGKKAGIAKKEGGVDLLKAAAFARKACDKGSQTGCTILGTYFLAGKGVAQDLDLAKALFAAACAKENGLGCYHLGLLNAKGEGVRKSMKEAMKLYQKACKLEVREACLARGRELALKRDLKSRQEALALILEACRGGVGEACFLAGEWYLAGKLAKQDMKEAGSYFKMACAANYKNSCEISKDFHDKYMTGFHRDTVPEMEKACAKGDSEGCATAGDLLSKGFYTKKDLAKGRLLLEKSCSLKNERGCALLKKLNAQEPQAAPKAKKTSRSRRRRRR